jgi:hypothetical protein
MASLSGCRNLKTEPAGVDLVVTVDDGDTVTIPDRFIGLESWGEEN